MTDPRSEDDRTGMFADSIIEFGYQAWPEERTAEAGMTDEEIVVAFALTRLDSADSHLDIEDVAALVVHRLTPDQMLDLASRNLATRDELRGKLFDAAVEHVLRTVLTARGPID